jgi:FkbM family methyltransferase
VLFYLYLDERLWGFSDMFAPTETEHDIESDVAFDYAERQEIVCSATRLDGRNRLWDQLCKASFVASADNTIVRQRRPVHVVQIGAHIGFEKNDPFAKGLTSFLNLLSEDDRQNVVWTFVEPSPPNFKRLQENIRNHSDVCQMRAVNAGVVSDSSGNKDIEALTFYSISESIDPETGHDSKSNKTFPFWVTQISSFSLSPIMFNERLWTRKGLNVHDYIVETNVTALRYSSLMRDHVDEKHPPLFVLIDTEGFDCKIVLGMSNTSDYLPPFLVYEHKQCGDDKWPAVEHLHSMNYTVTQVDAENTFAYKQVG